MKSHDKQPVSIATGYRSGGVAIVLGAMLLSCAYQSARADIDSEIAARVSALGEVLDRLEFDADRIDDPPAYQQANAALSGDVCMAFTAQGDLNWDLFGLDANLSGEGEAEAPSPISFGVQTNIKGKTEGGPRAGVAGLANLSGAAVYRQCIRVIPWAILAWYKAWAEIPGNGNFPEVVPGEVFETPMIAEARQAPVAGDTFDALSADAQAFLVVAAEQLFDGLDLIDAGTTDGLSFLQGRIDSISQDLGVAISDVVAPAAGLGNAILPDPAQSGTTFGSVLRSFSAVPERIAALIPFSPDVSWLTDRPFGFSSLEDLDYCAVLDDMGVIAEIPVIYDFLDLSCDVRDLVVDGTAFEAGETVVKNTIPGIIAPQIFYADDGGTSVTSRVNAVGEGLSALAADASEAEDAVFSHIRKTVSGTNIGSGTFPYKLKNVVTTIAASIEEAYDYLQALY